MEGKRLDLDAPLISVRRITFSSAPLKDAKPQSRRVPIRSGHVENSGAVPFIWEKRPGHPKDSSCDVAGDSTAAPYLPPRRIMINTSQPKPDAVLTPTPITCSSDCGRKKLTTERVGLNHSDCGEDCDAVANASDALSCNESFSVKGGGTGLSVSPGFRNSTGQFSRDLQMEEYMMGRFLPAAQAMASGLPQLSWKKPPRAPVADKNFVRKTVPRRRLPLHYQFRLSVAASHDNDRKEEEEEDEEEEEESDEIVSYESTGYFSSMARGLISRFRLKGTFCHLNPVPGMKVRDLPPTKLGLISKPRIKSNDEGIVQNSWEAVHTHRLRNVDCIQKDGDNKLTTDSQTLDGSSSFHHSPSDVPSLNKNEDVNNKSKSSKTGSLDPDKDDIGSYWEMASSIVRMQGSGSTSPTIDRTQINSSHLPDTSNTNSSLVSITAGSKENTDNSYTLLSGFERAEESVVAETSEECQPQSKFSRVAEPDFSSYYKTFNCENKKENCFTNSQSNDVGAGADGQEKNIDNSLALSLLPPPLLKPPSDSWLQRTLPGISAKGPFQQSFLGIQVHPMNQTLQASRDGQKLAIPVKSSKMKSYQTTFSGVPKPSC